MMSIYNLGPYSLSVQRNPSSLVITYKVTCHDKTLFLRSITLYQESDKNLILDIISYHRVLEFKDLPLRMNYGGPIFQEILLNRLKEGF